MTHYDDVIMSELVRFGSASGPTTSTQIAFTGGGGRVSNRRWSQKLRRLSLVYVSPIATVAAIVDTFEVLEGPADSGLVRDWNDWNTRADRNLAPGAESGVTATDMPLRNTVTGLTQGDGSTTTFQMEKLYTVGSASHDRIIQKPQSTTVKVADAGTPLTEGGGPGNFTVAYATGVVTFGTAPGNGNATTWGGAFYIPFAFVNDELPQTLRTSKTGGLSSVPLVEVRT